MAKVDKFEQARRDGMAYAYKIVKEGGADALEKELKYRNIYKHPLGLESEYLREWLNNVKLCVVSSMKLATVMTLHDEFGFGTTRLNRYLEGFDNRTEAILDNFVSFEDFRQTCLEETGIDIIRVDNDVNVNITKYVEAGY